MSAMTQPGSGSKMRDKGVPLMLSDNVRIWLLQTASKPKSAWSEAERARLRAIALGAPIDPQWIKALKAEIDTALYAAGVMLYSGKHSRRAGELTRRADALDELIRKLSGYY